MINYTRFGSPDPEAIDPINMTRTDKALLYVDNYCRAYKWKTLSPYGIYINDIPENTQFNKNPLFTPEPPPFSLFSSKLVIDNIIYKIKGNCSLHDMLNSDKITIEQHLNYHYDVTLGPNYYKDTIIVDSKSFTVKITPGKHIHPIVKSSSSEEINTNINNIPISNICFPKNTPVVTDQEVICIDKIIPGYHTINGNDIVSLTKTISTDRHLIKFEPDSLSKNYPSNTTIMTKFHKIYYKGNYISAINFVNKYAGVQYVNYTGEILYNILLEKHGKMVVNNFVCETLDPRNPISIIYKNINNNNNMGKIINVYNKTLIKKNKIGHDKIVKHILTINK